MHNEVPGVFIPDKLMKRMEKAGDGASEEGVQIALELIEAVKKLQGVHGIHLMAVGWEEIVPRIVQEAGLAPKGAPKIEAKTAEVVVNSWQRNLIWKPLLFLDKTGAVCYIFPIDSLAMGEYTKHCRWERRTCLKETSVDKPLEKDHYEI